MSTLTEVERAAAALPVEEQERLLRHLSQTLAHREGMVALRSIPPPAVPKEELQRVHALIEAEFPCLDGDQ